MCSIGRMVWRVESGAEACGEASPPYPPVHTLHPLERISIIRTYLSRERIRFTPVTLPVIRYPADLLGDSRIRGFPNPAEALDEKRGWRVLIVLVARSPNDFCLYSI
jgi:hypothetical protein